MFVQRMPVTKRIRQVTLGDLGTGPGCSGATAYLQIIEHPGGNLTDTPPRTINATAGVALPATPGRLTWTVPATTLTKGDGYMFRVSAPGCYYTKLRTWAHNEPKVNPGSALCAQAPGSWRRMWHQQGSEDARPGCVDWPVGQRQFDSSMPTGWLVSRISQGANSNWDVVTTSTTGSDTPPCYTPYYPNTHNAHGASAVYWRTQSFSRVFSCQWSRYADLNSTVPHGWYYAQPWLTDRQGAPRDMYLKLDTIDYDDLLRKYTPVLRFDFESEYWNASAQTITDWPENRLQFQNPVSTPCASFSSFEHPSGAGLGWGLDTLVLPPASYPGTSCQSSELDNIDGEGDDKQAADSYRYGALDNLAYGRAVHDSNGDLWLQYWLFYYRNTLSLAGFGDHQGDWEMVQYRVGANNVPNAATYAQHADEEADACTYDKVEKYPLMVGGTVSRQAPVAYVAAGSQASYFGDGTNPRGSLPDDAADGNGELRNPEPNLVTTTPTWMRWPGRWGDGVAGPGGGESPPSPAQQSSKWDNPLDFHTSAGPCVNPDGTPR